QAMSGDYSLSQRNYTVLSGLRPPFAATSAPVPIARSAILSQEAAPMKLPRRTFLKFAGASVAAPAFSRVVMAETYPSRPITMIVPFAAGGPTDANARVIAEQMRGPLRQPVIIENVSGADGSIGTGRVARARPDGYTIELGTNSTHMLNGALYSLPYDVVNDFAPISRLFTSSYALFAR